MTTIPIGCLFPVTTRVRAVQSCRPPAHDPEGAMARSYLGDAALLSLSFTNPEECGVKVQSTCYVSSMDATQSTFTRWITYTFSNKKIVKCSF
ncbi:hypothetical protein BS78_04G035200 [Paspalum vaginatum]|nr:hypothetical protein BS78_04G035200 [Paspalum vaginatum]